MAFNNKKKKVFHLFLKLLICKSLKKKRCFKLMLKSKDDVLDKCLNRNDSFNKYLKAGLIFDEYSPFFLNSTLKILRVMLKWNC